MTVGRALRIVFGIAMTCAIVGAGIGYALGRFVPDYYRGVFGVRNDPAFDPISVGLGLGLSQGLIGGVFVGGVVALAVAWGMRRGKPDGPPDI
ncbi:MAG: hypothetical protein IRY99_24800 [Isosphaeraceae bacterium]|nr:hypothetical protein [Isosphaeraceae bacterium]